MATLYQLMDVNLDSIIDKHAVVTPKDLKQALSNVAEQFDEKYFCKIDNYKVVFNPVKSKATYYFVNYEDDPVEVSINASQRDYYLSSKYWMPL